MFAAFGVETMAPWDPDAHTLVDVSRDRRAGAYLGQQMSIAIPCGNAAFWERSIHLQLSGSSLLFLVLLFLISLYIPSHFDLINDYKFK